MKRYFIRIVWLVAICMMPINFASGATMYSTKDTFMGAGTFYGPGNLEDSVIFDVEIHNIGFTYPLNFVTPLYNNGSDEPNICGEKEIKEKPTGFFSAHITKINENVDACSFELSGTKMLVGVADGGPHAGQQVSVVTLNGEMVMTMDFILDLGLGKAGIIKIPFYGTTGEVTVPLSLQTQMGIEGGIDRAGSLAPGDKIHGRLGDFNNDGMLDGAIVVAGNMPLNSIILPGSPYALIRYFETDIPYKGVLIGKLPGDRLDEKGILPPIFQAEPNCKGETCSE